MTSLADRILENQDAFSEEFDFTSVNFKEDPFNLTITKYQTSEGFEGYGVRYKDLEYILRPMDIESISSKSKVKGIEKIDGFRLYADNIYGSLIVYDEKAHMDINDYLDDYEESSAAMQMLHDDMEGLVISCLSVESPTDEQIRILELSHYYYTKRDSLTEEDFENLSEIFSKFFFNKKGPLPDGP